MRGLAFVWFLASLFRKSWRYMRDPRIPSDLREMLLGMHTALVMFILYQLISEFVNQTMWTHIAWLRFGLLLALVRLCEHDGIRP